MKGARVVALGIQHLHKQVLGSNQSPEKEKMKIYKIHQKGSEDKDTMKNTQPISTN